MTDESKSMTEDAPLPSEGEGRRDQRRKRRIPEKERDDQPGRERTRANQRIDRQQHTIDVSWRGGRGGVGFCVAYRWGMTHVMSGWMFLLKKERSV